MRVQRVALDKLVIPEVRVNAQYTPEELAVLAGNLSTEGQKQPILVVHSGESYIVTDGRHRVEQAKARGDTAIDAIVREGDERTALLENLTQNHMRGRIRATDLVKVIGELTTRHGMDSDAIVAATGWTRDYVERLWRISEADPELRQALDAGAIGVGVAYELSRLPSHEQQVEVCTRYPIHTWTVAFARQQVEAVLAALHEVRSAAEAPKPSAPPVYRCTTCQRETDPRLLNIQPLCPDCFGAAYERGRSIPAPKTDGVATSPTTPPH